jgi:hypothetical protein
MKNSFVFYICMLYAASGMLYAQTNLYSQYINQPSINLRGSAIELGNITADFPSEGYVVVHFDGECYASVGDLIVVAASSFVGWVTNDGNVSIETSKQGFGRPFSHTRVYPVTAGTHTFYAVGQNFVETEGSGIATIYGTLTVEYFPDAGSAKAQSTGFVFNGDVTNTTIVAEQTIHVNAPGKIVVRFDGFITSSESDRIVLAASNTMNWSFNDGNVAVEAVNDGGDVDENSFSHTRVYNVSSTGDYTYYALAQVYGKAFGTGMIWVYGNLLVEYFPTSELEKILFSGFSHTKLDLNGEPKALTSIDLNAPESGKVMVVLDGYFTANPGYDVVLAASDNGEWTNNDGHLKLQALDLDQNRYSFSHTRVYNIGAGTHTFYGVGEIIGGNGTETADLFGALTVKYIPYSATAVHEFSFVENTFDIYPNPSNDEVHIFFKTAIDSKTEIHLLDVHGRVLKEYWNHGKKEMIIDVSTLPANQYLIKVREQARAIMKL